MPDIRAFTVAADTGVRTTSLAQELIEMFKKFETDAIAASQGQWTGLAQQAFDEAQQVWNMKAQNLSDAQSQVGYTMARNVNDLFDTDHAWSKSFQF
jgi:uncharacterized protein YukE